MNRRHTTRKVEQDELMTPSEAARVIGISADTVRTLSDSGQLATLRTVGGRRLFRRGDVEQLAAARSRKDEERKAASGTGGRHRRAAVRAAARARPPDE
jgi:excisionase family DNA binding protein